MKYEFLLKEAASENIYIIENADFKSEADALINGNIIGINKNVRDTRNRTCILAEELGHYHTTIGNILNLSNVSNRKQELKAKLWAYDRLIGLKGIISAYQDGCQDLYEMAEYLEVTENFLKNTLVAYRNKYGTHVEYEKYIITFVPTLDVKSIN
ncbi:ImmA/IrrE family metallo-endopeptidase [Bacteroides acidifaciens]|uniref:ImmA/IrrE family metallo-endopeptidase n=1 Tax=Bacteroides acidifaciens TaxID=85831 RepID=UPI0030151806